MSEYHGDRMPTREEVVSPSTSSLTGRVRERARSVQMSIERSQVSPELDSILDSISDLAKPVDTDVAPTIVQAQATTLSLSKFIFSSKAVSVDLRTVIDATRLASLSMRIKEQDIEEALEYQFGGLQGDHEMDEPGLELEIDD